MSNTNDRPTIPEQPAAGTDDAIMDYLRHTIIREWAGLDEASGAPRRRYIEEKLRISQTEAYALAVARIAVPPELANNDRGGIS
jgi:hypothetical protein